MINKSQLTKDLYNPRDMQKFLRISSRTLYTWSDQGRIQYKVIYARVADFVRIPYQLFITMLSFFYL